MKSKKDERPQVMKNMQEFEARMLECIEKFGVPDGFEDMRAELEGADTIFQMKKIMIRHSHLLEAMAWKNRVLDEAVGFFSAVIANIIDSVGPIVKAKNKADLAWCDKILENMPISNDPKKVN